MRGGTSLLARGEPAVWLTGGALAVCCVMIVGLLALVVWQGARTFWPRPVVEYVLHDGTRVMGQVTRRETRVVRAADVDRLDAAVAERVRQRLGADGTARMERRLVRTGNFERTGEHFRWVDVDAIRSEKRPREAMVLERVAWGRFYGTPVALRRDGEAVASGETLVDSLRAVHRRVRDRVARIHHIERVDYGRIYAATEKLRLAVRRAEIESGRGSDAWRRANERFERERVRLEAEHAKLAAVVERLEALDGRWTLEMRTAQGDTVPVAVADIVRFVPANALSPLGRARVYASRWVEFLTAEPREANSEGGVWPAIVGTVIMTLLMSLAVVPFGVCAALYLREYARAGAVVSAVRIAINNLAGVPSIVFGVFGLGFFCYIVGGTIDQWFFPERLPNPTFGSGGVLWASLTLALLTLPVVVVATEEALAAVPQSMREGSYACGASKWQTIRRIVLPRAMPGIMTGLILAMARGAGEVAPLMLVGAVKLAPDLPIDSIAPFLHPERSFMHLGFHIFDVGFQSQNSEAAKPMVYTTTLLLIAIIATLNLSAIWLRGRLRRRFVGSKF